MKYQNLIAMKYLLFITSFIITYKVNAQKKDSCTCIQHYSIKYPKKAQDNNIGGTVIIEFDRDSNCVFSNPVVEKSLGYGCDEEALRIARQMVIQSQKCAIKCPSGKCKSEKIKWPITFQNTEEK